MKLRDALIDLTPLRVSRAFRVVFTARLISVFGLGFALVALPMQVYAATGSSALVAVVSAVNGTSIFGGTLVGGVLADRFPRRRLIVAGRASATVAFTGLALNALWAPQGGAAAFALICLCAALNGFAGTFSTVALQAAVPGLLPRDRLPAAGALLALTGQLGSIAAPALSGAVIALWGYPAVFGITAAVCAVTTVLVLRLPPLEPTGAGGGEQARGTASAAIDGMRFAVRHRTVGPLLALGFVQLLFATPYVLIPEFTDTVLHAGETAAGLLYSASAAGAVLASLTSGWTRTVPRTGTVLLVAVGGCGLASAGFGASGQLALALAALTVLGFAEIVEEILRFALLQSHTPDALRGRVNSVWTAQNTAGGALGSLALGSLAPLIGAGAAVVAGGAVTAVLVAVLAAAAPGLRRAVVAGAEDQGADTDAGPSAPSIPRSAPVAPVRGAPEDPGMSS
ncbi:enterobactin transporter EntS [Streptomonospora wellingtoniae]|uniref:Multidrug efflux pump Tap n=1 Tax=Streptomonospora wellingtoniae TaxID=3075544 RepID=A0ABU2KX08_9ACTN|nr:enterobactin transporter EntS [Streptomonospora sp. DSM 45055]MDT0303834.1 enterobactin transporter EntS [Streptomonospora sp. DSM 45055]